MDGIHDMGGLQGFGPLDLAEDRYLTKDNWRARMFGIELSFTNPGGFSLDWSRHVQECIPPAVYLDIEYYDRWYRAAAAILVDAGWATLDELVSGKAGSLPDAESPPLPPDMVPAIARSDATSRRPAAGPEAFAIGDKVRAKMSSPLGHTRLPRYLRGHVGQVHAFYGWQILPDAAAKGEERAEPLYCVSFLARELWDDVTAPKDRVFADLWESYLAPA